MSDLMAKSLVEKARRFSNRKAEQDWSSLVIAEKTV